MKRRELIQRGLALSLLGGVAALSRRSWGQQTLSVGQTLALVEVDELKLTPQDSAQLRPIVMPLLSASASATPRPDGGEPRRAGGRRAGGGDQASRGDQASVVKHALIGMAAMLYGMHQRDHGGESAESFRARLEKQSSAHELTPGMSLRVQRMAVKFSHQMTGGGGVPGGGGGRRRGAGGTASAGSAGAASPDKALKALLREAQSMTLKLTD